MSAFEQFWRCFDYWLERYQTLVAAGIAIALAIYTVRPTWLQLKILRDQRADQLRERRLASYKMLTEAIKALNPEAWRAEVKYALVPNDEKTQLDFATDWLSAYRQRKSLWAQIRQEVAAALEPDQLAALTFDFDQIDERFAESDVHMEGDNPPQDPSALWFYAANYPDLMVVARMDHARSVLLDLAAAEVAKIAEDRPRA